MADPLELETRRRIYAHIMRHPGQFLREIQRALDMAMGSLEFNLDALVKHRLATVAHAETKPLLPPRLDAPETRAASSISALPLRNTAVIIRKTNGDQRKPSTNIIPGSE